MLFYSQIFFLKSFHLRSIVISTQFEYVSSYYSPPILNYNLKLNLKYKYNINSNVYYRYSLMYLSIDYIISDNYFAVSN